MPGHMDKGTKNYRDMMKRMDKDDPMIVNPERPSGMMGGTPADLKANQAMQMMKALDPRSVVREGEMADINKVEDAISGLSMADKEALDALTSMGISLEDAIEAIMGTVPEGMIEGAMGATMGGGALGALPMSRPTTRPDEFGADRTQSMDMQKTGMGT